ncbi:hypothetical protein ACLM5H_09535 [Fredinandcohnia humi]
MPIKLVVLIDASKEPFFIIIAKNIWEWLTLPIRNGMIKQTILLRI